MPSISLEPPHQTSTSAKRNIVIAVALVAGVALALRWIVLASRIGLVDADEAVVGLMARHVLHGQFPAFFWGQTQGGTIEPFLVALSFKSFGSNGFAVKVVPLMLFGASSLLVWRIG
ncbi:MAG TPA: hypothetical protein VGW79_09405, partial [Actinomycetota bacterium]|nr:hypothetical protein [Actinomycetota bacterium]